MISSIYQIIKTHSHIHDGYMYRLIEVSADKRTVLRKFGFFSGRDEAEKALEQIRRGGR